MKTHVFRAALAAIVVVTAISLSGTEVMALFGKNVLFSRLTGVVLLNGKPVANAELEQSVAVSGKPPVISRARSDGEGRFAFEEIAQSKGLVNLLPSEFVAAQEINIRVGDQTFQGWLYTKRTPEAKSESDGRDFKLVCDIGNAPDYTDQYFGVCKLI